MEAYELLARVLKVLKRENEITPRLEVAARRDSKNIPLQYVLADRYREVGENDKAERSTGRCSRRSRLHRLTDACQFVVEAQKRSLTSSR